jgi:hypothetical protein
MTGAELDKRVARAVSKFWSARTGQAKSVKKATAAGRDAVVGGAQMNGFVELIAELLKEAGLPDAAIYRKRNDLVLPGFYRPTKNWDLIVVVDGKLLASVEFKSQVGSFGNNYNNRTEEALGNATDLWRAFQEGAFHKSPRPWLGWLMLLEERKGSTTPVRVKEPFFAVFPEFKGASYAVRYELLCRKLVRERLYDAACLLLSNVKDGRKGTYREPAQDVSFRSFAASLTAHAAAYAALR